MASVCSRYNAGSDWLTPGHYSLVMPTGRLRIMQIRKGKKTNKQTNKNTKGYPKPDHICFICVVIQDHE